MISKGHYHYSRLSNSIHRPLNSPTRGVRHYAGGA